MPFQNIYSDKKKDKFSLGSGSSDFSSTILFTILCFSEDIFFVSIFAKG